MRIQIITHIQYVREYTVSQHWQFMGLRDTVQKVEFIQGCKRTGEKGAEGL